MKAEISGHKNNIERLESKINELNMSILNYKKHSTYQNPNIECNNKFPYSPADKEYQSIGPSNPQSKQLDILMCFDSNGRYIDRRKLWKVNNSEYRNCGTIHEVSNTIKEEKYNKGLKYILLNVGVNDIDKKDHDQVLEEMELLIREIRTQFPDIKLIISEITPRNDERDKEVQLYNKMLQNYAVNENYITIAYHSNLREPQWSMYRDHKHIA